MVSAFSHFTLLVTSLKTGHCLLKLQWKWTMVKWFKNSGVVSGLTASLGRKETESKRRLCTQKHAKTGVGRISITLEKIPLGHSQTAVWVSGLGHAGEDRERLMSKSEDSFPLQVQTWKDCGGFLQARRKWGRNFNCMIWVFGGNKRLDQLRYVWNIKRIERRGYTHWVEEESFSVLGGSQDLILAAREGRH